ncbi:MAG TPA: MBL fold metallo-hydrolase, partial [Alphaproteobacteria bacterium]|nr:MBL fold metallo-hydrolase [Alphaproteobacteria bacterium]
VKPGQAVLTHLGLEADYAELAEICPPRTEPGVDGMVFQLD